VSFALTAASGGSERVNPPGARRVLQIVGSISTYPESAWQSRKPHILTCRLSVYKHRKGTMHENTPH